MARFRSRHGHGPGKELRRARHLFQRAQQAFGHVGGVGPLHHHVDGRRAQDAVILGLEGLRRDGGQVGAVAAELDARGRITVKAAAGLAHAVQSLVVELGLQAAVERLFFNAHGSGSKAPSTR